MTTQTKKSRFSAQIRRFVSDETGSTSIEYGLICALMCVVIVASITGIGTRVEAKWTLVGDKMKTAAGP